MGRKIKNPEKYVEKLRARIAALETSLNRKPQKSNPYRGECVASWASGIFDTQESINDFYLGDFNPGDYIVVTGIVQSCSKKGKGSFIKFERRQTKRVQAID